MNQVVQFQPAVENYGSRSLTAADVRAQVNLMRDVMDEVMIKDTHFGVIPGTKQPSLYKAGAEKIMSTFRLAADPTVEDLGRDGEVHYRVRVAILSNGGAFLGAGMGECSSQEDKYAWRASVCDEEFNGTPENRRRIKFAKVYGSSKTEQKKQVRTNPADVANTILKMAKKRGMIDGVLTVTAASDLFTQDIEDLPAEVVAELVGQQSSRTNKHTATVQQPENSAERDTLLATLQDVADTGMAALTAKWGDIGPDNRKLIGSASLEALKARAVKADEVTP
jgi:hypothetical protein